MAPVEELGKRTSSVIREHTQMLCGIVLLAGIVLLYLGRSIEKAEPVLAALITELGIVCVSVCIVSLLYEKFLAEKHFDKFREQVGDLLAKQTSVQSACTRAGITEVFDNRNDYEAKHPIEHLFKSVREGGRILVVGRTMFHFLGKVEAIRTALRQGADMQLAIVGSPAFDKTLGEICGLTVDQLMTPLGRARQIIEWIQSEKPPGSFELRTYVNPLPDSLLFIQMRESDLVVWDLTFGPDLGEKRIFLLDPCSLNLGSQLLKRYDTVWKAATPLVKTKRGEAVDGNALKKMDVLLDTLWRAGPKGAGHLPCPGGTPSPVAKGPVLRPVQTRPATGIGPSSLSPPSTERSVRTEPNDGDNQHAA